MPSFVRPRGSTRGTPVTPMSERQQMALLMQMTSRGNEGGSRSPSSSNAARNRDRNERGETPLHLAAIKGDVEQVCRLLAHRADPNVADFAGWTPLHEACNRGWHEVAFRLVQAGASVNAKGLDDDTPLHDAVVNGHLKLARMLVENGADVHIRNSKGKTPLDVAPPSVAAVLLNPNLPIPESSVSTRLQPRSRDDKKIVESAKQQKSDEAMETSKPTSSAASGSSDDVYEFKKESDSSPDLKSSAGGGEQMETDSADPSDQTAAGATQSDDNKRNFADMSADGGDDNEDDVRRKKRKEDGGGKDGKAGGSQQRNAGQTKGQGGKAGAVGGKGGNVSLSKTTDRKSPVDSPKPASTSDQELEEGKSDLKVPPLKIVIPQGAATEQESGPNRNGKSSSQRSHQALPYVVPSSGGGGADGEKEGGSGNASPTEAPSSGKGGDEKKEANGNNTAEDQRSSGHHQRVLRSSHRSGPQGGGADRSSNNSSPQLQHSHSPSPTASPAASTNQNETPTPTAQSSTATTSKSSDAQVSSANSDSETTTASTSATSGAPASAPSAPVELHPRKRKMRPSKDVTAPAVGHDQPETPAVSEVHPHEQPITNCYQLYLNIRKQIGKRRKGLFPVQPKPPQGFKDYLMNRCTYVLASTAPTTPNITYPATLPPQLKDLFADQEKERYKLRMQHVIEKEKLVLSVEQEILRVHGRAARALANQSLPFSVCTILRDEEVYNLITPEQEEKDRNARSRYNGRLFLSWLQDVDDKWEKIKEHMLLRHHNEAESLYAVQKMDWEWKMKELSLCDAKTVPTIDETHVPMVHVSDDFDLLPA